MVVGRWLLVVDGKTIVNVALPPTANDRPPTGLAREFAVANAQPRRDAAAPMLAVLPLFRVWSIAMIACVVVAVPDGGHRDRDGNRQNHECRWHRRRQRLMIANHEERRWPEVLLSPDHPGDDAIADTAMMQLGD